MNQIMDSPLVPRGRLRHIEPARRHHRQTSIPPLAGRVVKAYVTMCLMWFRILYGSIIPTINNT
jgi:hypothetical protein